MKDECSRVRLTLGFMTLIIEKHIKKRNNIRFVVNTKPRKSSEENHELCECEAYSAIPFTAHLADLLHRPTPSPRIHSGSRSPDTKQTKLSVVLSII